VVGIEGSLALALSIRTVRRRDVQHNGHGVCGHELRAHFGQVAHVALEAPADELLDELVELRGPHHPGRDRPRQRGLLMGDLRRAVAAAEPVGADDRDGDDPADTGPRAGLLQVAPRGE
jgi:hypothetical protein